MHTTVVRTIAEELITALDHSRQIEPFSSRFENFEIADAYLVADSIHQHRMERGESPVGRKIGFTNPEVCAIYGVREPIWGYVYDSTLFYHSDSSASYNLGHCTEPRIEPEIVMHFHSSPPEGADISDILKCIDWVAHGFEIVQSHFPQWKFQAADTVADCGLHGMLIVGEPVELARLGPGVVSDLETFSITLSCDAHEREQGRGSNALGNPLKAVLHLLEVLAKQPFALPLHAGELVTTGTLTDAFPVKNGQTWSTVVDGIALPGLSVSFDE